MMNNSQGASSFFSGLSTLLGRPHPLLHNLSDTTKRGRLWLNDGSCIRLRPLHKNHVWSYDFVSTRTHDGRALKLLTVLDEYTRQCLAIKVGRK